MNLQPTADPQTWTFEIPDIHGKPHKYLCRQHPGLEGMALVERLRAVSAVPLLLGEDPKADQFLRALMGGGDVDHIKALFKYTSRQAVPMDEATEKTRFAALSNQSDIDDAYRANYDECVSAMYAIGVINRFFSPSVTSMLETLWKNGKTVEDGMTLLLTQLASARGNTTPSSGSAPGLETSPTPAPSPTPS